MLGFFALYNDARALRALGLYSAQLPRRPRFMLQPHEIAALNR
ncbi:hypothetical protein [Thioclava sp. SK-1]|nr:hypothetical protein [Thioclava sp. SK-1]